MLCGYPTPLDRSRVHFAELMHPTPRILNMRTAFACAAVFIALLAHFSPPARGDEPAKPAAKRYAIVIHGGAGTDPAKMTIHYAAPILDGAGKMLAVLLALINKGWPASLPRLQR